MAGGTREPINTDVVLPLLYIWCRQPGEEGETINIDAEMPIFRKEGAANQWLQPLRFLSGFLIDGTR